MSWACVVTFWHQQEDVVEQLVAKGFEYFFPRIKRIVRHRGRRVHRLDPLLFNYVPVVVVDSGAESAIRGMRGVVDVIGPASCAEIMGLKSRCTSDGILIQPVVPRFRAGQAVHPRNNPLMVGKYVGPLRDDSEAALFNILGAKRSIRFEIGNLVAA